MIKSSNFHCINNPVTILDEKNHADFFKNVEKAILLVLKKNEILTDSQWKRCMEKVKKRY